MAKYSITCPYCGTENFSDAQLCRNCGRQLPVVDLPNNHLFSLTINRRHLVIAAIVLIICSTIIIGYLIKRNNPNNYLNSQYRPYELIVKNRQGQRVAHKYVVYKITGKKADRLVGKALFLTKKQAANASGVNIQKYFRTQQNYPLTIDQRHHQLKVSLPDGPVILKNNQGKKETVNRRIQAPAADYDHYTMKMLDVATP